MRLMPRARVNACDALVNQQILQRLECVIGLRIIAPAILLARFLFRGFVMSALCLQSADILMILGEIEIHKHDAAMRHIPLYS